MALGIFFYITGPQDQVSYWPEEERRHCPAIIERGSGAGQEGGRDVADASLAATGLPAAELARLGIPLSDTALMKIYPRTFIWFPVINGNIKKIHVFAPCNLRMQYFTLYYCFNF